MSNKFNGFSQDEINKLNGIKVKKSSTTEVATKQGLRGHQHIGIKRIPDKFSSKSMDCYKKPQQHQNFRPQSQSSGVITSTATSATGSSKCTTTKNSDNVVNEAEVTIGSVILDRSMSKSIEEALFYQPLKSKTINGSSKNNRDHMKTPLENESNDASSILYLSSGDNNASSNSQSSKDASKLSNQQYRRAGGVVTVEAPFKGISLKDFESHRKMIEEQNKQKKELLHKAIEQYSQKTAAEARKIEDIKSELAKLDNDLAVDVAMLRKQIDIACVHFANVEKQYIKMEAQFLKAKIELHNAAEKKELLTEHLCTVIAHNEDRKAQKLTELMEKVGITTTGDYEVPAADSAVEK